jgi:cathepsin L
MKTLVLLTFLCLAFAFSIPAFDDLSESEIQEKFISWMDEHEKSYGHEEWRFRYATWKDNLQFVLEHNARNDVTFTVEMNKFADLTSEEFNSIYNRVNMTVVEEPEEEEVPPANNPTSVDWTAAGAVTGVKDQGQCGSCWSFSATGAIEGAWGALKHQKTSLSEQELVSCDNGDYGCNGGWPIDALSWSKKMGGLNSESGYPYTSGNGVRGSCQTSKEVPAAYSQISGYTQVSRNSESALETAVASRPVSVCIDASHRSFQLYSSGIYYESACSSSNLDHAVLATGYSNSGTHYWIVKNSWGTSWGQRGYIWMSKDRSNNCGIAAAGVYATPQ